uniref:N-acetyltransferase domain-containing protein n=1 Tax=Caenorhabditis tropicalis TaxID=1561998 RepID=A0A1I7TC29_9PELO
MSFDPNSLPICDPELEELSIIIDSEENAIEQSAEGTSGTPPVVTLMLKDRRDKKREYLETEGFHSWESQKEYLTMKEGLEVISQFQNLIDERFKKLEEVDKPSGSAKKVAVVTDNLLRAVVNKTVTKAQFLLYASSIQNDVVLGRVDKSNIEKFKEIVEAITPFNKHKNFYNSALETPGLVYIAFHKEAAVGAIFAEKKAKNVVSIKTLGVLPAFKERRIGELLFGTVLANVEEMKEVRYIEMYIQAQNNPAIYMVNLMGFKKTWMRDLYFESFLRKVPVNYYRKPNTH